MLLSVFSCTTFVLTDGSRTLYFNNEHYSNPSTRIWFVPAGKDYFGCAYLGFDDNWAQCGVNTEGLAFDWVAGFEDAWTAPAPQCLSAIKIAASISSNPPNAAASVLRIKSWRGNSPLRLNPRSPTVSGSNRVGSKK